MRCQRAHGNAPRANRACAPSRRMDAPSWASASSARVLHHLRPRLHPHPRPRQRPHRRPRRRPRRRPHLWLMLRRSARSIRSWQRRSNARAWDLRLYPSMPPAGSLRWTGRPSFARCATGTASRASRHGRLSPTLWAQRAEPAACLGSARQGWRARCPTPAPSARTEVCIAAAAPAPAPAPAGKGGGGPPL